MAPTIITSDLTTFYAGSGMDIPLNVFPFMLRPTPIKDLYCVFNALTAVQYKTLSRFLTKGIGIFYKLCMILLVGDILWIMEDDLTSFYQVE